MVKRVFGRVDGCEVELYHSEGDRWKVPVPFDQDGEYVIEIIAEDEAGNQSYLAKMLWVVDTNTLCTHMILEPFWAVLQEKRYETQIKAPLYYAELVEPVCEDYWKGAVTCRR